MRDRGTNISIKWKLVTYFVGFALIMLGLLWLFQIGMLDSMYKNIKAARIRAAASVLAGHINGENLHYVAEHIARANEMSVIVLDEEDKTLVSLETFRGSFIHGLSPSGREVLRRRAQGNGGTYIERLVQADILPPRISSMDRQPSLPTADPAEILVYVMLVPDAEGHIHTILLNVTLTPVSATVETLRVQLVYITSILMFIGMGMALLLSRHISTPLIRLNAASRRLVKGRYDTHFDGEGYLEVAELAETLNQASRELTATEALRQELLANVSHDLRTPLTMIIGYAEVVRDLPGESTPENLQVIIDEAKRLTLLVNDMMDLSKLRSGSQGANRTLFSLTQSIRDIMARFAKLTEQEGYHIHFRQEGGEVLVEAEETRIGQVLYNLINNAIHYTGPDRQVAVSQMIRGKVVRVEVTDTGPGIPPEELPHIWERYYKGKKNLRRQSTGSGLGLSIVSAVLDAHRAAYGAESRVGQGSTFWFELDIAKVKRHTPP